MMVLGPSLDQLWYKYINIGDKLVLSHLIEHNVPIIVMSFGKVACAKHTDTDTHTHTHTCMAHATVCTHAGAHMHACTNMNSLFCTKCFTNLMDLAFCF